MTDSLTKISRNHTANTLAYYNQNAAAFWQGTKDHDVTQNYSALLNAIPISPPFVLLDLGCGPGRDLAYFRALGHDAIGLDGSARFAEMARDYSGAEVWVQDFVDLDLPSERFDGVFANASLFHVPKIALNSALREIWKTLKPGGVLFTSNPRGNDQEGLSNGRFGVFYRDETWISLVSGLTMDDGGFDLVDRYLRPQDAPPDQQRWLATVWRKFT